MSEARGSVSEHRLCCDVMRDALCDGHPAATVVFNPTLFMAEDGTLLIPVGYLRITDEADRTKWVDVSWLDVQARFCPFCGSAIDATIPPFAMN
jgi:hypothetical protein